MKVGSSLDSQIWYEPYHANEFKLFMKTDLFKSFLMNECKVCNVFWFLVLINPVLVTSKQLMVHLYPEMSVRKCEYLFVFSLCRLSMLAIIGIVSSYMCNVFMCVARITMSGFSLVTQSAGGIVPPPGASIPGKSLNTLTSRNICLWLR